MKKIILFSVACMLLVHLADGASNYYRNRVASGFWNNVNTWEKANSLAGPWSNCTGTDYPGSSTFTPINKYIIIKAGTTIDCDINLTFATGGTLKIDGTLNMSTYSVSSLPSLIINGTLNTDNFINSVSFFMSGTATFKTAYIGSAGWWSDSGPTSTTLDFLVEFNGGDGQVVPDFTYFDLTISGTGTKHLDGVVNVTDLLTVSTGTVLQLGPASTVTSASIDIAVDNGLVLKTATSGSYTGASLIVYNLVSNKKATAELCLTGGYIGDPADQVGRWHYISSPFTSLAIDVFTANTSDLAQWVDGMQSPGSLREGWVAYDGFMYLISDPLDPLTWTGPTFSSLNPGKGYNFWDNLASYTYSLSGVLSTSDVTVNLDYAGQPYENGFNLLGNPFSSGLNWDDIANESYNPFPANTSKAIYFTRDNNQCSYVNGVGDPGDVTGVIPPMQGFFVKTYSTGNSIVLSSAAQTHNSIHARYKSTILVPMVRLEVEEDASNKAETVIRFDNNALAGLDNNFDAIKMNLNAKYTYMYSSLAGAKFSINGLPFPILGNPTEVPVVINLIKSGSHTFTVKTLQGLDNYDVTLKDLQNNIETDLKSNPSFSFNADAGLNSGRFLLHIDIKTGIEKTRPDNNDFSIYQAGRFLFIEPHSQVWNNKTGEINVFDLSGKTMETSKPVQFTEGMRIQLDAPVSRGIYLVEVKSGIMKYTGKVVIR